LKKAADDKAREETATVGRLKKFIRELPANLYVGFLTFFFYPLLLLFLPTRIPERVVKLQGDLVYFFGKKQREKVIRTLDEKLAPGKTDAELKRIARDYFRILTSHYYYNVFVPAFRRKWVQRYVTFEGAEHLEESRKDHKGVILPVFHFNQPAAAPCYVAYLGIASSVYAVHPWDLNVPLAVKVNTWICYRYGLEGKWGPKMAYRQRGARELYVSILRDNGIFMALIDVSLPGGGKHVKALDFLGERFLFPTGITNTIYETGSAVHIAYCVRDTKDWRRARLVISPRLPMTGDSDKDIQAIVSAHEAVIREHPEQWWGWLGFERGTLAFREALRKRMEEARTG
jgi:lauroyl/myristoyl acyltransferase